MKELSLHLLDIAENSISASAENIFIKVKEDTLADRLSLNVIDNGKGMNPEMVNKIVDPFVTSRTTRKVGLGIPLLKAAAEACNGFLIIESEVGKGTKVEVEFQRSHIDRMPMGDLPGTLLHLIIANPEIHWNFQYQVNDQIYYFDDETIKKELEGIPLSEPLVLSYIRNEIENGIKTIKPSKEY